MIGDQFSEYVFPFLIAQNHLHSCQAFFDFQQFLALYLPPLSLIYQLDCQFFSDLTKNLVDFFPELSFYH